MNFCATITSNQIAYKRQNAGTADNSPTFLDNYVAKGRKVMQSYITPIPSQEQLDSDEKWLPVPGYEGVYEVSSHGRVKRVKKGRATFPGRILKGGSRDGYKYVLLCLNGKVSNVKIHPLVAAVFIGKRPNNMEINHIDLNRSNNRADNLEYLTHKENIRHAAANGHGPSAISEDVQRKVRELFQSTKPVYPATTIAKMFGISPTSVAQIASGNGPMLQSRGFKPLKRENPLKKLTDSNIREIKSLAFHSSMTLTEIAKEFGVSLTTVSRIKSGTYNRKVAGGES